MCVHKCACVTHVPRRDVGLRDLARPRGAGASGWLLRARGDGSRPPAVGGGFPESQRGECSRQVASRSWGPRPREGGGDTNTLTLPALHLLRTCFSWGTANNHMEANPFQFLT